MKNGKKYFILLLFVFLMSFTAYANTISFIVVENGVYTNFEMQPINLFVNDQEMDDLPAPPVIYNEYTLVPAREVFEPLGAFVDWNEHSREIYIVYDGILIILQMDNIIANVDGTPIQMDIPVKNINDKTMIPARFVSETLDFIVEWEETSRSVFIWSNSEEEDDETNIEIPEDNQIPEEDTIKDMEIDINADTPPIIEDEQLPEEDLAVDDSLGNIVTSSFPETNITRISIPNDEALANFIIQASSEISEVQKMLLPDNRLVIDIVNANMNVSQTTYILDGESGVSSVRIGQFETSPVKITRIVFELNSNIRYNVSLSSDRKQVVVSFEKNLITNVSFNSDGISDHITIDGMFTPNVSLLPLENPSRLVIDIAYSEVSDIDDMIVSGVYANSLRISQYDENTTRIVVDLSSDSAFYVTYEDNRAIVRLLKQSYQNIFYDTAMNQLVITKDEQGMLSSEILQEIDDYLNLRYVIKLPDNYESHFGYGDYIINNALVDKISINTYSGSTEIVINTKRILTPIITEDDQNIYLRLVHPRERYEKIVVIDPGHGGQDPGVVRFGLQEKDIVLDMSLMLYEMLTANDQIKPYATRLTDVYPTREDRAAFANDLGDLFLSVHVNSFTTPVPSGTETYYYNGSIVADQSRDMAIIMQRRLLEALGTVDRGHKSGRYIVLTHSDIPSALLEIAFLSNEADANRLATQSFRLQAMEAVYEGILEMFETYTPKR